MNIGASKARKPINHRKVAVIPGCGGGREADTMTRERGEGGEQVAILIPDAAADRGAKKGRFPTTFPNLCFADLLQLLARSLAHSLSFGFVYHTRNGLRSYRFCHLS